MKITQYIGLCMALGFLICLALPVFAKGMREGTLLKLKHVESVKEDAECEQASQNDPEARTMSATIMGYVGLKGYRKSDDGGSLLVRVAFYKKPRILFKGNAPEECMDKFKKRAEKAKRELLADLQETHLVISAREILQCLPLSDEWDVKPPKTKPLKKKRTFKFLRASETKTFTVPPIRWGK